jgi:CubicO group peptidase (beta-lactamase class C family)
MNKLISFYHLFLVIAFVPLCNGQTISNSEDNTVQTSDQTKSEKIEQLVSTYAEYGIFNGSVLISHKGKIIFKKGYGMANLVWDIPNKTDTKFRLASVTKQFTAMLIMQLVAENKLALDSTISTYLQTYPEANSDKITIHQLLTHTSGIPNYTSFSNYGGLMRNPMSPTELIEVFADSTLQFTPGERFSYSNSGYVLLGAIIEKITGRTYGEVLQEKIFTPLKMTNSGFKSNDDILKNRASGYYKRGDGFVNSNYIDMSVGYAAGGIYSTVEDLYIWDQALYTEKLLPSELMKLIFTEHIPAWGQHYGYGWNVGKNRIGRTEETIQTIHHDGVINGFSSIIYRFPEDQSSILLLNNTGGAPLYKMSKAISGILYDKTYDFPKKSIARSLLAVIKKDGVEAGQSFFEKVKTSKDYNLDEREMNNIGYEMLQSGKTEEAVTILKLNLEAHPTSFNANDSYAEILMNEGHTVDAIMYYKKSLALNPKNENGIQMLKKLGVEINRDNLYFIRTEDTWGKEIFTFPLRFAKDIKYQGVEEAHFPKGWRDQESSEFWSYVFAWNVDLTNELKVSNLESDLQLYFDGLAEAVNKDKTVVPPNSIAKLDKIQSGSDIAKYRGTIKIYDSFVTNKPMTLKVQVESHYCPQKQESIILFRFSPKAFGHEIWSVLEMINLRENMCED